MKLKTDILKKLIEQMVAKEVKRQIPILLQELLYTEAPEKSVTIIPEVAKRKSFKELLEEPEPVNRSPAKPKELKQYTKDPLINQILNETVNDLSMREGGRVPHAGIDSGFESVAVVDDGTFINESISPISGIDSAPVSSGLDSPSVLDYKGKDAAVDNLMKWDFKAILEKSKKKK